VSERAALPAPAKTATPVPRRVLQRKCACGQHAKGGECEGCRKKSEMLQRKESGARPQGVPPIVHDVLRSSGQPLDPSARAFLSPRFGRDLSQVRVHRDARAAASAEAVGAQAYTVGRDIVFGEGRYAPESSRGLELLAHELTHVAQQAGAGSGEGRSLDIAPNGGPLEREADGVARSIVGQTTAPSPAGRLSTALQRQPEDEPRGAKKGGLPMLGGTLPYREATELHKCIEIMGKASTGYCREVVLGEKTPPKKIPAAKAAPAKKGEAQGSQATPGQGLPDQKAGTGSAQVDAPPPASQTVSKEQAQEIAKTPLPSEVKVGGSSGDLRLRSRFFDPVPREPTQFGLDLSLDSSVNFQLSFVARHMDATRFRLLGKGPIIDFLHEPTLTMGVSLSSQSYGVFGAQLTTALFNLHFQRHGNDLIELAVGQLGFGFDTAGNLIGGTGAQAEIHLPNPHFSFTLSTGGTLTHAPNGSWTAAWTNPITLGFLIHLQNP
jgi:hypothetical protein